MEAGSFFNSVYIDWLSNIGWVALGVSISKLTGWVISIRSEWRNEKSFAEGQQKSKESKIDRITDFKKNVLDVCFLGFSSSYSFRVGEIQSETPTMSDREIRVSRVRSKLRSLRSEAIKIGESCIANSFMELESYIYKNQDELGTYYLEGSWSKTNSEMVQLASKCAMDVEIYLESVTGIRQDPFLHLDDYLSHKHKSACRWISFLPPFIGTYAIQKLFYVDKTVSISVYEKHKR